MHWHCLVEDFAFRSDKNSLEGVVFIQSAKDPGGGCKMRMRTRAENEEG